MPTAKTKPRTAETSVEYRGRQTRTGNSLGFRFEGSLFKSHPEFSGEVRAKVIAPGRMLLTAEPASTTKADPVLESFLAFLASEMARTPESIQPLDADLMKRVAKLTKGVRTSPDEDLGDEVLL